MDVTMFTVLACTTTWLLAATLTQAAIRRLPERRTFLAVLAIILVPPACVAVATGLLYGWRHATSTSTGAVLVASVGTLLGQSRERQRRAREEDARRTPSGLRRRGQ